MDLLLEQAINSTGWPVRSCRSNIPTSDTTGCQYDYVEVTSQLLSLRWQQNAALIFSRTEDCKILQNFIFKEAKYPKFIQ